MHSLQLGEIFTNFKILWEILDGGKDIIGKHCFAFLANSHNVVFFRDITNDFKALKTEQGLNEKGQGLFRRKKKIWTCVAGREIAALKMCLFSYPLGNFAADEPKVHNIFPISAALAPLLVANLDRQLRKVICSKLRMSPVNVTEERDLH